MLPGVSATATIRPQRSARQWIFVVLPPRETPTAWLNSPLFHPDARAMLDAARRAARTWTGEDRLPEDLVYALGRKEESGTHRFTDIAAAGPIPRSLRSTVAAVVGQRPAEWRRTAESRGGLHWRKSTGRSTSPPPARRGAQGREPSQRGRLFSLTYVHGDDYRFYCREHVAHRKQTRQRGFWRVALDLLPQPPITGMHGPVKCFPLLPSTMNDLGPALGQGNAPRPASDRSRQW